MTLKAFDFEGGTEGAAPATAAAIGAQQITTNGGSVVYARDVVRSGALGLRFTSAANALCIARFTAAAANVAMAVGIALTMRATPATLTGVLSLRHSGGVAGRINWTSDNTLQLVDAGLGSAITIGTGLTPGVPYEITIRPRVATATTGTVIVVLYAPDGTELGRASTAAYNLGTNPLAAVDVGIINSNPAAGTQVSIDILQLNDGATTEQRIPSSSVTGSATLTGAGTLTATGAPAATGSTALTGSATLAATGTAAPAGTATMTGVGSLAAAGQPRATADAVLAGAGGLTAAGTPRTTGTASLVAAGVLTATGTPRLTGGAALDGSSTLHADSHPTVSDTVALVGAGTLTAEHTAPRSRSILRAELGRRRTSSTLGTRRITARLGARRWEAHL